MIRLAAEVELSSRAAARIVVEGRVGELRRGLEPRQYGATVRSRLRSVSSVSSARTARSSSRSPTSGARSRSRGGGAGERSRSSRRARSSLPGPVRRSRRTAGRPASPSEFVAVDRPSRPRYSMRLERTTAAIDDASRPSRPTYDRDREVGQAIADRRRPSRRTAAGVARPGLGARSRSSERRSRCRDRASVGRASGSSSRTSTL